MADQFLILISSFVEVGHTLRIFSLNVTVPGYYTYYYGNIQSDSEYCLGRERLDVLIPV